MVFIFEFFIRNDKTSKKSLDFLSNDFPIELIYSSI